MTARAEIGAGTQTKADTEAGVGAEIGAGVGVEAGTEAERRALYVVLALGMALRFFRLSSQSYWYDEAVSADLGRHDLWSLFTGRARDLGNPPLHNLVLHGWMQLFGDGDTSLRAVSALAGSLSLPLFYAVGRRLVEKRTALWATALFALSPFHIYLSQEMRTYALVTLISLLDTYALLRAIEWPERTRFWLLYGIATFLAAYAHYYAFFLALGQLVFVARWHRRDSYVLRRFGAAVGGAALLYVVWLPSLVSQLTTKGNLNRSADSWYLHGLATPLVFGMGTTLVWKGLSGVGRLGLGVLELGALGLSALVGARSLARTHRSMSLLLLWLLFPVALPLAVSALLFPFYVVRYGLIALPAFLLLVAAGLTALPRRRRMVLGVGISIGVAVSLTTYYSTRVKHDWRGAAAYVEAHNSPQDLLLFDADFNELSYARYAHGRSERRRLLPSTTLGAGAVEGVAHAGERVHDLSPDIAGHDRVWIIASDPDEGVESSVHRLVAQGRQPIDQAHFRGINVELWSR